MVLTGIDGRKFSVQFQHEKLPEGTRIRTEVHGEVLERPVSHRTRALIYDAPWKKDSLPLAVAEAHCSTLDMFTRKEGRFTAFDRLVNNMYPPENRANRPKRDALWKSYWAKVGDLKKPFPFRQMSSEDRARLKEVIAAFVGEDVGQNDAATVLWAKVILEKMTPQVKKPKAA